MADDLASFYAEIASLEAVEVPAAPKETGKATAAAPSEGPSETAAPVAVLSPLAPPPIPPPTSQQQKPPPSLATRAPLPPPPRPPPSTTIRAAAVISAPPKSVEYDDYDSNVPEGPALPPPPVPPPSQPPTTTNAAAGGASKPAPPPLPPNKRIGVVRQAAGERWVDPTLIEWPDKDFRIFVGNLAPEVTDAMLVQAFSHYASFQKARVVRNVHTNKTKGFGFVSFGDTKDGAQALKEMHGQYIASRPVQLKKSKEDERTVKDYKGRAKKRVLTTKPAPPPKRPNQGFAGGQGGGFY